MPPSNPNDPRGPFRLRPSAVHLKLARATASLHHALERRLGLLDPGLSRDRYLDVLCTFYGFFAPVEERLARIAPLAPPLGLPLPARAVLLARDLRALGVSSSAIARLPRCRELPALTRAEHLGGCLYVLEGSSLGGRVIARAVGARLGLGEASGAAFFVGEGDGVPARWGRVLAWLDELPAAGVRTDAMVAAARDTFARLTAWADLRLLRAAAPGGASRWH